MHQGQVRGDWEDPGAQRDGVFDRGGYNTLVMLDTLDRLDTLETSYTAYSFRIAAPSELSNYLNCVDIRMSMAIIVSCFV